MKKTWYKRNKKHAYATMKAWRKRNRRRWLALQRKAGRAYYAKLKRAAYAVLGNACKACGEIDTVVLQIDHVAGGGTKEMQRLGHYNKFYREVVAKPKKYQLLCANCNWRKRAEGE